MKPDAYLHKRCLYQIQKTVVGPIEFGYTFIYDDGIVVDPVALDFEKDELAICSTIVDLHNWCLLTTRKLISVVDKKTSVADMEQSKLLSYGRFKNQEEKKFTKGKILNEQGEELQYWIEVGVASMVMIQGIKTRTLLQEKK